MSPNILANTVWFKPGLKSWVRQTALIVYLENSLALRFNPEPFPLPESIRHCEFHLCLLHFVLSLSRINSASPEYHNWPATSSRDTMSFSSASSVIGCYISRFSSKCSRLDNYPDLYQTPKFCRGPCCRFRVHLRRRSHLAHPESNVALTILANVNAMLEYTTVTLVKQGSFSFLQLQCYALLFLVSCMAGWLPFRIILVTYRVFQRKVNT
jgi:hypothetical protein